MNSQATPAATLTLADLAKTFESTVWQDRRVYVNDYATTVYLTLDSDGDMHVSIGTSMSEKSGTRSLRRSSAIEGAVDAAAQEVL